MDLDQKMQQDLMDAGSAYALGSRTTKGVEEEDPTAPRESLVQYREPEVASVKPATQTNAGKKAADVSATGSLRSANL